MNTSFENDLDRFFEAGTKFHADPSALNDLVHRLRKKRVEGKLLDCRTRLEKAVREGDMFQADTATGEWNDLLANVRGKWGADYVAFSKLPEDGYMRQTFINSVPHKLQKAQGSRDVSNALQVLAAQAHQLGYRIPASVLEENGFDEAYFNYVASFQRAWHLMREKRLMEAEGAITDMLHSKPKNLPERLAIPSYELDVFWRSMLTYYITDARSYLIVGMQVDAQASLKGADRILDLCGGTLEQWVPQDVVDMDAQVRSQLQRLVDERHPPTSWMRRLQKRLTGTHRE